MNSLMTKLMLKVIVIREDDESVALMLVLEKVSWLKLCC